MKKKVLHQAPLLVQIENYNFAYIFIYLFGGLYQNLFIKNPSYVLLKNQSSIACIVYAVQYTYVFKCVCLNRRSYIFGVPVQTNNVCFVGSVISLLPKVLTNVHNVPYSYTEAHIVHSIVPPSCQKSFQNRTTFYLNRKPLFLYQKIQGNGLERKNFFKKPRRGTRTEKVCGTKPKTENNGSIL